MILLWVCWNVIFFSFTQRWTIFCVVNMIQEILIATMNIAFVLGVGNIKAGRRGNNCSFRFHDVLDIATDSHIHITQFFAYYTSTPGHAKIVMVLAMFIIVV